MLTGGRLNVVAIWFDLGRDCTGPRRGVRTSPSLSCIEMGSRAAMVFRATTTFL